MNGPVLSNTQYYPHYITVCHSILCQYSPTVPDKHTMEKKGKKTAVETKKRSYILADYKSGERQKQQILDMKNLLWVTFGIWNMHSSKKTMQGWDRGTDERCDRENSWILQENDGKRGI